MTSRNLWTREEMFLALNLYMKLPFGRLDRKTPEVMHLANLIGRTPNAVALRLVNFAAYDPDLKRRGISGMSHGGKVCKAFWDEFINDRERLLYESEQILAKFENHTIESKFKDDLHDIPQDVTGETRERMVKSRVNQNVFRQIVLSNYEGRCALTGIDIPELLVASHVIPWSEKKKHD